MRFEIITTAWFVFLVTAFTIVDAFEVSPRYRVQDAKNVIESGRFRFAVELNLLNIVVSWLVLRVVERTFCMFGDGIGGYAIDLIVCFIVEEICFYYSHRAMHTKMIYKYVHSIHHSFSAPSALTTIYAHPVEHVVCNLMPLFAGPLLVRPPMTTWLVWWLAAITSTVVSHSGYRIGSAHHNDHHRLKNVNFGLGGMLDRLHGTSAAGALAGL